MPFSNVTTKRTQGASHQHIAIHLIDEWAIPDCMDWFVRPAAAWKLIETMNHSGRTICRILFMKSIINFVLNYGLFSILW